MKVICCVLLLLLSYSFLLAQSRDAPANRKPDGRYKADILVLVAHPDDETAIFSYLAKACLDEKKRIAIIYGMRPGGGNEVGIEHASSLGAIREIEARRALASYGIHNVWFLDGQGSTSQNVLLSLSSWKHGQALEQAVRLVRLTRPEVILTFMPALVGEHSDHQAAGVIATEAFDMAGDRSAFPSQLAAPRRIYFETSLEGLGPWQPKKIYYFTDSLWLDLRGTTAEYSNQEVSPSRKVSYEWLAAEEASFHLSQEDFKPLADVLTKGDLQRFLRDSRASLGFPLFPDPVRLKLGKSHVKTSVVGDIFQGVASGSIAYVPPRGFQSQSRSDVSIELGGPWAFYRDFWRAHNLDDLSQIVGTRLYIRAGETLQMPLMLRNDTNETQELILTLASKLPEGWHETPRPSRFVVEAGDVYPVQALITTPARASDDWQEITYAIQVKGRDTATVSLQVQLRSVAIPQ